MACSLEKALIEKTVAFHGHNCPGLAIGIRASELAMETLSSEGTQELVCVTETDMCGVDAIQFLTGCTFGKGNLVHKDFGKSAFTFYDRKIQKGVRAVFKENSTNREESREERIQQILDADLKELFATETVNEPPVRPPRILKSIQCISCGEMTMETRIRLFEEKAYCIPCFQKVEQKV